MLRMRLQMQTKLLENLQNVKLKIYDLIKISYRIFGYLTTVIYKYITQPRVIQEHILKWGTGTDMGGSCRSLFEGTTSAFVC